MNRAVQLIQGAPNPLAMFVGQHRSFRAEIEKIPTIARYNADVLIVGETGTGKDLCARAIHALSARSKKPFVAVCCAAIDVQRDFPFKYFCAGPEALPNAQPPSWLIEADGGTVYLDLINELPSMAQSRLGFFLKHRQEWGSPRPHAANVRIIGSSSDEYLAEKVQEGGFHGTLFYLMCRMPLALPALRRRRDDIPL